MRTGRGNPGKEATIALRKIQGLKVTTDGWVDTSSIESILAGATRGAKTDEEKILAIFNWCRRIIYHHRLGPPDSIRRNLLMAVNSFGFNLCGSQSALIVTLLNKAGFKTRVVCGKASGDFGGHTFWEAFYDERWHCFDTMTSFYVYTRDTPPHIACLDELKADPTLVSNAVEENRASPGFLCCTFRQELKGTDRAELAKVMGEADLPWSTFLFTAGSLVDFWSQAPRNVSILDAEGAYGGRYTPDVMTLALKPGEELARTWNNQGKWIKNLNHADFGPHHICGTADEYDPVNFKYFEPYLKENYGHAKKCYRYYGNGWLEWKPTAASVKQFCKLDNMAVKGADIFEAVNDKRAGTISIPVKCPYAGVEVELDLTLDQAGASSETRVLLVEGNKSAEVWKKAGEAKGLQEIVITRTDLPLFEYELKIECKPGQDGRAAALPVRLRTTFMENIAALPGFLPGKNVVTVGAARPVKLAGGKLIVQYDWEEGEGWKTPKTIRKEFTELPATFEVEAAGPKIPRMRNLITRFEPAPQ
jgi:hypothetical protein